MANPPYSVKGFLETLSKDDIERYELTKTIEEKSYTANNAIECFFIEKAKQILKADGVVGIVLPSSILSKGDGENSYVATREILIKYFEIIAIAEFGSGTFGKTGTNTVTLFLRRRDDSLNIVGKYRDFVDNLFVNNKNTEKLFKNKNIIEEYCSHIDIDKEIYMSMFKDELNQELFKHETFAEYRAEFEKSTETKNRKKRTNYTKLTNEEKENIESVELLKYIKKIEADKLYYFCLADESTKEVLIVKAPSNGKENKKFLGYEWSGRKGNEGIQYSGGTLNTINTPLYNPNDSSDKSKINSLIAKNFTNENIVVPKELEEFVSMARLIDMIDFSRRDFNKAFGLNAKKKIEINSKYHIVKISEICEIGRGRVINKQDIERNKGIYPIYSSQTSNNGVFGKIDTYDFDGDYVTWTTDGIYAGTCSFRNGKFNCTNVCGTLKSKSNKLEIKYLPYALNQVTDNYVVKTANPKLMNNVMASIKIPLPPLNIQKQIVKECELIDDEVEKANTIIQISKEEIIKHLTSSSKNKLVKLGDICNMKAGKFVSASNINDEYLEDLYPCYGGNGLRGYVKTSTHNGTYPIIGRQGALCGNVMLAKNEFHATEHAVVVTPKIELDIIWLYQTLVIMNLNQYKTGVAQPGLSVKNLNVIDIKLPPLKTQKEIVTKIEKLENTIAKSQKIIDEASEKKQAILRKYL
ncbi:Type I restriction-modification system, specificity subunit S [hydrothermal vent metagenome]|uniref:Type I restriction-modification system, specificity subunit S n=1 Tax=hydrothermal vent metagenome TaxID=652676 RepID=A0A1W1BL94_9ZZZZ